MSIFLSLSKLKTLLPALVVGGALAITIKLLTQETPQTSKIMQVKAEEDILSPEFQEKLEEPQEPEVEEELEPVQENEVDDQKDNNSDEAEVTEQEATENEVEDDAEKKQNESQPEEETQGVKLTFKENGGTVVEILKLLVEEK